MKPRKVQINGKWYDVSEWMGSLQLTSYGSSEKYTAKEPFAHMSGFYHVFDNSGYKVGEFHVSNRNYSGQVTGLDV